MSLLGRMQAQQGDAWVEMFELDLTRLGGALYRFAPETNEKGQAIVWRGQTYNPLPIEVTGYSVDGQGRLARPTAKLANVGGIFSALVASYGDLLGAPITRYRTLVRYMDAENFAIVRRNLQEYTESMGNWLLARLTVSSNLVAAPDGNLTADKLVATAVAGSHYLYRYKTLANGRYTASVYVKAAEITEVYFYMSDASYSTGIIANLAAGTYTTTLAGSWANSTYFMQDVGNGWWRIGVSSDKGAGTTMTPILALRKAGSTSFTGDGVEGCYAWGLQVEEGELTDYFPVTGGTWTANPTADPNEFLPADVFYVNRKIRENPDVIEFELTSPMELEGQKLPARIVQAFNCGWQYRGDGCDYVGPPVADVYNNATTDPLKDDCSRSIAGCKLRNPPPAELPFGAFPSCNKIPRM